ncbi:MAG: DUF4349 domain-containing protein, partial [Bacteroidetes bacterium]|nr:DUF4349 domain-containing protein [Bacteroidota bacterium]
LVARLKNKKAVEQRYVELLRSNAEDLEQIFLAEEKIRMLREEIEAKEGRLRYLNDRVGLSSINLTLYEEPIYITEIKPLEEIKSYESGFIQDWGGAFISGWNLVLVLVLGLTHLWPLLLLGMAGFLIVRKRYFKRNQMPEVS